MAASERERAMLGRSGPAYYEMALERSRQSRQDAKKLHRAVPAEEQVWERSPQGLIKHLITEDMQTAEPCLEIYQQFLEVGGRSGKHRHMTEELLYIVEGEGFDLHWDPEFHVDVEIEWTWAEEPKKFEWKTGDFVFIPAWAIHQHFQRGTSAARFISAMSRQVGQLGFDWIDQLEAVDAPPIPE
jgi:quercetin dioxygenase-like cupin family protein